MVLRAVRMCIADERYWPSVSCYGGLRYALSAPASSFSSYPATALAVCPTAMPLHVQTLSILVQEKPERDYRKRTILTVNSPRGLVSPGQYLVRAAYAMSGTDVAHGVMRSAVLSIGCHAMGTDRAHGGYAMSGTDIAFGATRCQNHMLYATTR
eukprot:2051275-Rhodomonas_salina.2